MITDYMLTKPSYDTKNLTGTYQQALILQNNKQNDSNKYNEIDDKHETQGSISTDLTELSQC